MSQNRETTRHSAATRRQFLQLGGAAALACAAGGPAAAVAADPEQRPALRKSFKLGVASYTFRSFDLDKTLAMTRRAGLTYICLKSMHMPLDLKPDELAAIAKKVAAAGLTLYGAGVIDMSKVAQITQAFEYGKAAGLSVLVASPDAARLPFIDEQVKKYDIRVAIHNHGPGDKRFPTPESVYEKIAPLDKRIGLCIDIGHTVRYGEDLVRAVHKCRDRILDMHIKDVTAATAKGRCIQLGRGVIDFPVLMRALAAIDYQGVLSYEYEVEDKDPLPGLCECVGYTKGVAAAM